MSMPRASNGAARPAVGGRALNEAASHHGLDQVGQWFEQVLSGMFDQSSRLHRLEPEGDGGGVLQGLLVEAFSLREALNAPWELEVVCLGREAGLDLDAMLGRRVVLSTVMAHGELFKRRGLVLEAQSEEADGGLARYRLVIGSWFSLLAHTRRSQVFQDQPLTDILAAVFAAYAPEANWRPADSLADFLARSPWHDDTGRRPYTVQYRETDLAFVTRLLAEEGVVLRFEPETDTVVLLADTPAEADVPQDASAQAGPGIRFHREDPTETSDTVRALGAQRVLPVATLTAASYNHATHRVVAARVATAAAFGGPNAPRLEAYDHPGTDRFADAARAERALVLEQEGLEARHKRWLGRGVVRSFTAGTRFELLGSPLDATSALAAAAAAGSAGPATARGTLRDEIARRTFLLTAVTHAGINNLPKQLSDAIAAIAGLAPAARAAGDGAASAGAADGPPSGRHLRVALLAPWIDEALKAQAADSGYANAFEATRAAVPWRPATRDDEGHPLHIRPQADGPLTATVVGPRGESQAGGAQEIHTDALGRIRIRFDFQCPEAMPHAAPGTSQASLWVRVAQRWAGAGVGAQFLPRVGQEVLVDFLEGDMDRPVVIGSLYNGRGEGGVPSTPGGKAAVADMRAFAASHDHAPSAQGTLGAGHAPAWHGASAGELGRGGQRNAAALSGIRSREFGSGSDTPAGIAAGGNQLVFDDSDGQLRTQLATTQHATQLNLGHLIHQADNHRGSLRGLGFELRTDAYGAVRARRGVLITTAAGTAAQPAGDNTAGMALSRQLEALATAFDDAATQHQAVRLASRCGSHRAGASAVSATEAPLAALRTTLATMVRAAGADDAGTDAVARSGAPAAGTLPHLGAAMVAVQAQGGLAQVAGQDHIEAAAHTVTHAAGQDWQQASGGDWRVHAGQAIGVLAGATQAGGCAAGSGLTFIAAREAVHLQAQAGPMQIDAQQDVQIQSRSATVQAGAAKKITLATAGGASVVIEGGNITVSCPGTLTIQAGQKSFSGPGEVDVPLPTMPGQVCVACLLSARQTGARFVIA